jgi:hypothetical protein
MAAALSACFYNQTAIPYLCAAFLAGIFSVVIAQECYFSTRVRRNDAGIFNEAGYKILLIKNKHITAWQTFLQNL